jgi:hypothetical protein
MKSPPLKLWSALEALPGLAAVAAEWREFIGDEFDALKPCFREERDLARSYPDPHGGEPLRVVVHGPNDIVAVGPDADGPLKLTRRDLIVHRFDAATFRKHLASLFELEEVDEALDAELGLHLLGEHSNNNGIAHHVYLALGSVPDRDEDLVNAFLSRQTGPSLLITPTPRRFTSNQRKRLQDRSARTAALSELLAWSVAGWRLRVDFASGREWLSSIFPAAIEKPVDEPSWIREHFRQQQSKLLTALWGQGDVPVSLLKKVLNLDNSVDDSNALRTCKTRTNRNLLDRRQQIGADWMIRERTRDGVLSYFLHCESTHQ